MNQIIYSNDRKLSLFSGDWIKEIEDKNDCIYIQPSQIYENSNVFSCKLSDSAKAIIVMLWGNLYGLLWYTYTTESDLSDPLWR